MSRKSLSLILIERGGDKFPNLAAAQQMALPQLAADVALTIRQLLAAGVLIQKEGRIIPNPEVKNA
jgi:hypothetical protein